MDYDIIATLGPGSSDTAIWSAMLETGVTGFRLNTSHLTIKELEHWLERLQKRFPWGDFHVPVVLDLQGSKWRLGEISPVELNEGEYIDLVLSSDSQDAKSLPVPHLDFFSAARHSDHEIVVNDAKITLRVIDIESERIRAVVEQGGPISSRKGITYRSSDYRKESMNEKDRRVYELTNGVPGIRYAISYVKDSQEMDNYRQILGGSTYLIAKLERYPAIDQIEEMENLVDECWVCRGDLGSELGLVGMAERVYRISKKVGKIKVPVFLAGQILEHMTFYPHPTRSEVSHLYEILNDGYRGIVLSDETAIGNYVLNSCKVAALWKEKG
jgi:pyruvate kinase